MASPYQVGLFYMVCSFYIYSTKLIMPQTLSDPAIHIPVDYDDGAHRYSFRGSRYTSATQLIELYKRPFDVEERSLYMSHRYGNTPEYWKRKWINGNGMSLDRGNGIHDEQERELYQQKFIDFNPVPLPVLRIDEKKDWGRALISLPDGVYPEMKLWRHDCRIAGRSDKVVLRTVHRSSFVPGDWPYSLDHMRIADIEDYKTNKKIRKFGFQNPDGTTEKMLPPIAHIEDAEWWHYALQLSEYQYMLEYHGFLPGYRRIIHFPHPTDEFPNPKPVTYELPYLRNEVIAMIAHFKTIAA